MLHVEKRDAMILRNRRILLISIAVVIMTAIWIERYTLLYHYYLWRLNNTVEGSEIMDLGDRIQALGPHVVSLLVQTYEDVRASPKSRGAAAAALTKVDREKAKALFSRYLSSKNEEIVADAIFDLGHAQGIEYYTDVLRFVNSPSENIRWAVVYYLGKFNNKDSIVLLRRIMASDSSEKVRNAATYRLQLLGDLPGK